MSFGFGISDFVCCATLAHKLSVELREGPRACLFFSRELVAFNRILLHTGSLSQAGQHHLDESGQTMLTATLNGCKELLYIDILGLNEIPENPDITDHQSFSESIGNWPSLYNIQASSIRNSLLQVKYIGDSESEILQRRFQGSKPP